MNQITVIKKSGATFNLFDKTVPRTVESATQNVEILGRDTVSLTVKSALPITFDVGDKIVIIGRVYTLNLPPVERKAGARLYFYDLEFEGMQYELMRAAYSVNVDTTTNEIQDISGDSLTGDLKLFLDVLVSNANRVFGSGSWSVGSYPASTETKTLSFAETDNCLNVLQSLCSEDNYNAEFWITIDGSGNRVLNVGASGSVFGTTFEYGKDKGLYELTRERLAQSNVITRLHAYGSSKNIVTSKYIMPDGTFRGLRLCLPTKKKGTSFLDDATAISKFGLWEATKHFEDIYPHRTGTVSDYGEEVWNFIDLTMDFDLNELEADGVTTKYLIPGTTAKVHFNTGNLAGYEFEIEKYDHNTKTFTIIQQTDENGYKFPSETSSAFQIAPGDEYVITDIYLPTSYVTAAESKLLTEATAYLNKYKNPQVKYSLTVDPIFLKDLIPGASSNIFWAGDYIPIKDTAMGIDTTIRVKSFTRDLIDEYKYTLTITDLPVTVSTVTRIVNELKELDTIVKYNNLGDPARARRNYKVTGEVLTMVEALQVEAALIGNDPAAQFELVGVSIMANYNGQASALYASGGTINHNYYPEGGPASWNISPGSFGSLVAVTPYYLYVKATKGSSNAIYVLSATKIAVESVTGYYHFPVGVLSSVIDNVRVFTSTKGYTLITGDSIKTGKIQSASVPNMYIDLSTGEIRGNFKFTTGETVQEYIGEEIGEIKVGGKNLVLASLGTYTGTGPLKLYMLSEPLISGETYSISVKGLVGSGASFNVWVNKNNQPALNLNSSGIAQGTFVFGGGAYPSEISVYSENSANPSTVYWVKIEKGNKPTDWTPAPEDVPSALEYLADALQGSTDISGGLLATNVLLMKTLAGLITGGMSGLSTDNIGMWTGGTYQQAIDALAKVIFRKDGSGQLAGGKILWDLAGALNVGNFKIENGAIVGKDAGAIERLKLSIEDIQTIASMASNYAYATDEITDGGGFEIESQYDSEGGFYYTQIIAGSNSKTTIVQVVIPYATFINVETPAIGLNYSDPGNVVSSGTTRSVTVKTLAGATVASGNVNSNIQITAAGTYNVHIYTEVGVTLQDGTSTTVDFFLYNTYIKYIESVEKTQLGKDGFFSYFSSSEYIHFKKTQGLKVKGSTDIPGVLASGSISSAGSVTRTFGAKYTSGSRTTTGTYRINHSIGHTNYAVLLTSQVSARLAYVGTKYNDYVIIYATNTSGTLTDTGLDFLITGNN